MTTKVCRSLFQIPCFTEKAQPVVTSSWSAFGYCKDAASGVIYLHGNGKQLVNMDIDCDGQQGGAGEDGRCGSSGDTQSQTSFKDTIVSYKVGINDLNAKVHTYVVFGNDGTSPSFDPQKYGIEPLSVMAVVCGDKLVRTTAPMHRQVNIHPVYYS
jgi:hypothetical protein